MKFTMKPWMIFTAARYLRSRRREKKLSTSFLSILGIAVGVMALNGVIGVMNGFQLGTIEDILELNSFHLQWKWDVDGSDLEGLDSEPAYAFAREASSLSLVRHAQPFLDAQALIQGNFSDLQGIQLRGIDPEAAELDISGREMRKIIQGTDNVTLPGTIVIGRELARFLGVRTGDRVGLVSIAGPDLDLRNPEEISLLITGIFETGYYPYDRNWGIVSIQTLREHFGNTDPPMVGIKLHDRFRDQELIHSLQGDLGDGETLVSWRILNRAIFGALRVEKGMMFFLVSLIFLVVGVNIFQGLKRVIYDKTRDIGVFKALGASPSQIQGIFILEGWLIGLIGSIVGTLGGILIAGQLNQFLSFVYGLLGKGPGFATQYFFLASIPVELVTHEVILIGCFGVISAVLAARGASLAVRDISPIEVLREE